MTDDELRRHFAVLRAQLDRMPQDRGHFWIFVLLFAIAAKTGACQ